MADNALEKEILKDFMLANFDYDGLKQAGFWINKERRNDFYGQAARVCIFFGLKSIYEYSRLPPFADVYKPLKAVNIFSLN